VRGWLAGYLVGWLFWWSISLGSAALLLLHALTGGRWARGARRVWVPAASALPGLSALFLPVLFGVGRLYPWAVDGRGVLSVRLFAARAVTYLVASSVLARVAARPSRELTAALGLAAYFATATLAAVDWMMTLEPRWSSTVYGLVFISGQGLAALALAAVWPGGRDADERHDLGNLLLAFTMLWAYCAFSQLLVIWSGDLPHENSWYLTRARHGWGAVAALLVVGHFAAPFNLLLWRRVKRARSALAGVALALLSARALDLWWQVAPAVSPARVSLAGSSLISLAALGAAWAWLVSREAS
jgi:hypothetical protein